MMYQSFKCIVFLGDGKRISQVEPCDTASEAIRRASAWRTLGHKAEAYLEVIDIERREVHNYPLS
jgi:hypothetical protein